MAEEKKQPAPSFMLHRTVPKVVAWSLQEGFAQGIEATKDKDH